MDDMTHESFMGNGWSDSIEPSILVSDPRSDECCSCKLFCVETISNTSRAVLSLRNRSWDCFRFETLIVYQSCLIN